MSKVLKRPRRISRHRDVEHDLEEKYAFDLNTHTLYSFDVCGGCEAHAILMSMEADRSLSVSDAPLLKYLSHNQRISNIALSNCPH